MSCVILQIPAVETTFLLDRQKMFKLRNKELGNKPGRGGV
jgi:hypothetical protein